MSCSGGQRSITNDSESSHFDLYIDTDPGQHTQWDRQCGPSKHQPIILYYDCGEEREENIIIQSRVMADDKDRYII